MVKTNPSDPLVNSVTRQIAIGLPKVLLCKEFKDKTKFAREWSSRQITELFHDVVLDRLKLQNLRMLNSKE